MRLYKAIKDCDEGVLNCPNITRYKTIPPRGYVLVQEYWVDKMHPEDLIKKVKGGLLLCNNKRRTPPTLYRGI